MKRYGKNPTLLRVEYVRPSKRNDHKECFKVVYINDDGVVKYTEDSPEVPIYIVKPEYRTYDYNKPEERIEHMDKIMVPFSKIKQKIIDESGEWGKTIHNKAKAMNNWKYENLLYTWPYVYGADFLPEFYFMHMWFQQYQLKMPKLTKAFLDIETDIIDFSTDLNDIPHTAFAPINVVSVICEEFKEAYQFVLRPYPPQRGGMSPERYKERYEMYERQLEAHKKIFDDVDAYIKELHERFDPTYGYLDYHVREYVNEIDLIADVFRYINSRKPNYCGIWNMRFDIQYFYWRIITLGYDPDSIMCSPDMKDGSCWFKEDRTTTLLEKQFDYFKCDSFTQYICSMRMYASIRKSQHKLRSVSLNAIADRELKDKKVEYPENASIKTFAYDDWHKFLVYNMKDSLLLMGIERKTNDMTTYYMRAMENRTPYAKIFREIHLLRDVREMYFEDQGWVQSNNLRTIDDGMSGEDKEKEFYEGEVTDEDEDNEVSFKGAINADPIWNDYIGEKLLGVPTNNLFHNSIDYDMGAFYPSIKIVSNMDPITLLYKASFNNDDFISGQYSNKSLNQTYEELDRNRKVRPVDITGEAVNTYASGNILTFGYNYLNLPTITELDDMLMKELEAG